MKYKPVIGLEIHAELNTKTKMFCDSLNDPDEKHPNVNICPICLSHPGTLPVTNIDAVKKVIMAGLALNCRINKETFFERKNYFYPDLPKGYQISQYQKPFCENGHLDIGGKKINITRIHLEEDAGRLYHLPGKDYSLVDFNRAGVPLMELVTEPDFESGPEVRKFAEELQLIWRYLGISDADMEKGQLRVEVNISLARINAEDTRIDADNISVNQRSNLRKSALVMGTKVEIKNLNSIKFAADAVDYEIKRQTELLDKGEKIVQETRGWDENKKATFSQRSKEEAHDYRYFPEPDLPPLKFTDAEIAVIKEGMFELPAQRRARFKEQYGLPDADINVFVVSKSLGNYFEHVASELTSFDKLAHLKKPASEERPKLFKLAANYLITELKRMSDEVYAEPADTKITPEMFADLMVRVFHGQVSSSGAQTVLKEMFQIGSSPDKIIHEKDLEQISDMHFIVSGVEGTMEAFPEAVQDVKKGKTAAIKFLVGDVMKRTKDKANPQVVEEILKEKLK